MKDKLNTIAHDINEKVNLLEEHILQLSDQMKQMIVGISLIALVLSIVLS